MVNVSLLGIPNDDNSALMKGAAEAPPLIRRELHSDAYSQWTETGIDLGISGMIIDALDPAHAPGVTYREPGGLSVRQVINWLHALDHPIIAADIVEYNPRCDISNLTASVAAKLLKEIAGTMVKTAREWRRPLLTASDANRA